MHKARIMINAMALEVKKLKYESCADHILLFIHHWIFAQNMVTISLYETE